MWKRKLFAKFDNLIKILKNPRRENELLTTRQVHKINMHMWLMENSFNEMRNFPFILLFDFFFL